MYRKWPAKESRKRWKYVVQAWWPGPPRREAGNPPAKLGTAYCHWPRQFGGATRCLLHKYTASHRRHAVGAQHAAPLLPGGYILVQDLRNGHLAVRCTAAHACV